MKLRIIHAGDFTKVLDEPLRKLGYEIVEKGGDAVILMSVSQMDKVGGIDSTVPLFVYDWDLYPGLIAQKTYDWDSFAELKRHATEVWVPSKEVAKRNKELYGIENWVVVRSFARLFKAPTKRGDYVFNGMREYPWDPQNGWLRQACDELGIPLLQPDHQLTEEKYREAVAGCRVAVCEFEEASTGGLTLIEAHALGKPVIFGDGEYMGAKDYFGWRGFRYKTGDYDDFKKVLKNVYNHEPGHDKEACWDWAQNFTPERMALSIHERLVTSLRYELGN